MGGVLLGRGLARSGASTGVSRGGDRKGTAQKELRERKGILERGGGRWGKGRRRDHLGTWARAPQLQFCSSPIGSPQMRAHRQNRGKTKCTFIKLKTQTPRVQENESLGRRRGGSGGQYPGTQRDRGWAPGLQELETRVPVSGMQIGSLGGRHCQGLGRGSRVQRLQPRGGWGGSFRGRSQQRKAGVPTTSTRSSGSHTQAGTAVEVPRLALHTATSWG